MMNPAGAHTLCSPDPIHYAIFAQPKLKPVSLPKRGAGYTGRVIRQAGKVGCEGRLKGRLDRHATMADWKGRLERQKAGCKGRGKGGLAGRMHRQAGRQAAIAFWRQERRDRQEGGTPERSGSSLRQAVTPGPQ